MGVSQRRIRVIRESACDHVFAFDEWRFDSGSDADGFSGEGVNMASNSGGDFDDSQSRASVDHCVMIRTLGKVPNNNSRRKYPRVPFWMQAICIEGDLCSNPPQY